MEGKINEFGNLSVERGGKLKGQVCPTQPENSCGDWCPLFGEPKASPGAVEWELQICQVNLYFEEFTDERKEESNGDQTTGDESTEF